jgi:zinc protease
MRVVSTTVILSLVVLGLLVAAASADEALELKFEKYTLSNGMDVILHEDHSIPMVAVNIWYHVGSKNEEKGRTGFAHLFEHMMFQGSENHDDDFFKPLQKIGGSVNGSTSEDRTNYWENVPSNYLELALWLESDRMGFLLPAMTQERLDNQRDVVKNERRERTDNSPYGHARELLLAMLFPDDHPYSWSVIGSMEDLSAASMEDVSNFFKQYYTPNNASLCIAGDFDPARTKMLVEKYFGTIPAGPPVERLEDWIPDLDGEVRTVAEDDVELARLYYAWHSPAFYAPGDAEMDLLANVLTSGKTSRLYRSLVYEQQIAQDVVSYQASSEVSSVFNIQVTVREGHTLEEAEAAVDAELSKLLAEGITQEELVQAQTAWEARFVRSLQQIGGFGGRAELLNRYNTYVGDPGVLAWDMARYTDATVASVQKYLDEYIDLNERAVLHMVPQGSLAASTEEVDRTGQPEPAAPPTFTPPDIQTGQLSNGVEILLVEDHRLPLVDMQLVIKSGWGADPVDRFGWTWF